METLSLARTGEGKKPQTIKHELGLLRAATRYAAGLGFRTPALMTKGEIENPWRVPEVAQKTRYLSIEEYREVYAYLDPERLVSYTGMLQTYRLPEHLRLARQESQDLLVALAYTGGRWSEIALLTWDRVHLTSGTIRLWAGKVEKERLVPMAGPLLQVLSRRHPGEGQTGLVFPGPHGRPRTKPSSALGDAMTAVGLNRPDIVAKYGKATCHSLRHTFASWLIQNGADLSEVKDALGHATVTTTTRYAHLAKGATMTKLGGILSKIGAGNELPIHPVQGPPTTEGV
jgi:integrase